MKDTESKLRPVPDWSDRTTLVPFSGLQILDFGFDLDAVEFRQRRFVERTTERRGDEEARELIPLHDDEERNRAILDAPHPDDLEYAVRPVAALEPFLAKWIPAPVLRVRPGLGADRSEQYDDGPFGWARLRVVELEERDPASGHTHRVQLAFDTTLAKEQPAGRYLSPDRTDSEDEREFRFVSDPDHAIPFLTFQRAEGPDGELVDTQAWVAQWLNEIFVEYKQARVRGRPLRPEDFPNRFEHLARYMALLILIDRAVKVPRICLVDVVAHTGVRFPGTTPPSMDVAR